jgi:nucleotide-binding universal stress UspA family protein|tara:strand:+ start:488 stop:994 length:507 start_codon:yes stop_codon:yes gene_type:complete
MIALKNILVPTDFGETSQVALKYALELASTYHGSLHVLHVVPDPSDQPWPVELEAEASGSALSELTQRWEERANEQLKKLLSETERKELGVRLMTSVGHPTEQILQYAKDQAVDLIVMGTLGRGTVAHTWRVSLGSVAERVVRQAPCPVLTVRHPALDTAVTPTAQTA